MRAFVLEQPGVLRPIETPVPTPAPDQVRIKIAYVGICGSDVETYLGHRRPEWLGDPPILGHEAAGIVDQLGAHVVGLQIGDRVMASTWGAFSEYVCCRPESVMKLLPEIPLIQGSLIEVLHGVMQVAQRCGVGPAHDVVVLGQGVSGLQLTRLLALNGCRRLIAIDLFDEKLALAREFGATHAINAQRERVVDRILEICGGGADYTVVATCSGNDVSAAVEWTRAHGKIVLYGGIGPCDGIDFFQVHGKAISLIKESTDLRGVLERRRMWREGMQLVADGLLPTQRLRTHVFPLERLPEAMELRGTPRPDVIHVLIENAWVRQQHPADDML